MINSRSKGGADLGRLPTPVGLPEIDKAKEVLFFGDEPTSMEYIRQGMYVGHAKDK